MLFSSRSSLHHNACHRKQSERQAALSALIPSYYAPLSLEEQKIHALSLTQIVSECKAGNISPSEVLFPYAKKTVAAHRRTNCISDFMLTDALRTRIIADWPHSKTSESSTVDNMLDRPLLGVPISIKDTVNIAGHDTTLGLSRNVGRPATNSSIVRLLQDAGAIVHVKTSVPCGLISLETASDLFGTTTNPYDSERTCGASTGGGAALVACGGSKIEIGSDLAGSVRVPAHWCGIWSLKGSSGRFPAWGQQCSLDGFEGLPYITAPMANSLADLDEFWKRIIMAEPWKYDHTCHPIPWKSVNLREDGRKLKWGLMLEDGVVPPSPACMRALNMVAMSLQKQGHEVVEFVPPDISNGLDIGYQLLFADGGEQLRKQYSPSELSVLKPLEAVKGILDLLALPRYFKRMLSFLSRRSDPVSADFLKIMHTKSIVEERHLVSRREVYRAAWHQKWIEDGLDFVLTVPHAFPAFKNGESVKSNLMTAGFTCLFSLLDYTAGIFPVTFVDKGSDRLPDDFFTSEKYMSISPAMRAAYEVYDPDSMHGLPLGVQIVGKKLEEEKVIEGMKIIEDALKEQGSIFVGRVPV